MKELSLNILDITENSTKAKAELVKIEILESTDTLCITITDDGTGMTEETLSSVANPFYTTRTTRKVGMGIPLFRMAAEMTGGNLTIASKHIDEHPESHGTTVSALLYKNHIDFTPLGDVSSSVVTLIQGNPDIDFRFTHKTETGEVSLDTRELREVLEEVPLDSFEVLSWIEENLREQYNSIL
jgi:signal transduction histidine kinase